jgi:hypothetical protein
MEKTLRRLELQAPPSGFTLQILDASGEPRHLETFAGPVVVHILQNESLQVVCLQLRDGS